ncbi:MerR family transcriptional regulator [Candidatus Aerophobetes bacterium]|nr:MerR family transcriptional regulator [Candidatus Aerophobetes bacterium]
MPEKKEIPEKLYFSIKEASKITNIAPHTLRFWEKKFPFLSPQKSKGGHRRYQKKDIEIILEIKKLIYERGFTIEGARKELQRERKKKESTVDLDFLKREIEEVIGLLD